MKLIKVTKAAFCVCTYNVRASMGGHREEHYLKGTAREMTYQRHCPTELAEDKGGQDGRPALHLPPPTHLLSHNLLC